MSIYSGWKVLAVSTRKGGVLKTSVTTNFAGILSESARVLIVDTDIQGDCALSFGKNPDNFETTIYDVLTGRVKDIRKAIYPLYKNIDILPANDSMLEFEFEVIGRPKFYHQPFHLLREALAPIMNEYDYIVIDTPANFGLVQGNVLAVADRVIIPFQPETYSMRSLVKVISAIDNFRVNHNARLKLLGVVATLVDSRTVLHSEVLSECRKYCFENSIHMFDSVIPRAIRFAASVMYEQKPATLADPKNQFVRNYFDLFREVEKIG